MSALVAIRDGAAGLAFLLFAGLVSANVRQLAAAKKWDNVLLRAWDYLASLLPKAAAVAWREKWWFWLALGLSSGVALSLWTISLYPASMPQNPLPNVTGSPAPSSSPQGPSPHQERIIADITPEALMAFYKGRSGLEAARLAAPYIGKWVKLTGTIGDLIDRGGEILLVDAVTPYGTAFLNFDSSVWRDRLSVLQPKQTFSAVCQLVSVGSSGVDFHHCELSDQSAAFNGSSPSPVLGLTTELKKQMIAAVPGLKPTVRKIVINRANETTGRLWNDLTEVFHRAGFGDNVETGFQEPIDVTETGVMICTPDVNSPRGSDLLMKQILQDAGIDAVFIPLSEAQYRGDLTIFVGPNRL